MTKSTSFLTPKKSKKLVLPLFDSLVRAGFPSPAEGYNDSKLDLNEYLVQHPSSTFFVRVIGDSMIGSGIFEGDMVVVDRSLEAKNGQIILAVVDGEFTIKKLQCHNQEISLVAKNQNYEPIKIGKETNFQVWGVVTYTIHKPT